MKDLNNLNELKNRVISLVEWKNLLVENGYSNDLKEKYLKNEEFSFLLKSENGIIKIDPNAVFDWVVKNGTNLKNYVIDVTAYLSDAMVFNKRIMCEAQLGALRDIDYGIFPYTSSSSTLASYAPIGAGIPFAKVDEVIGIAKAYSSCVGEGPFTVEMFGDQAEALRKAGGEYGAATGRPRRVGPFDVPATTYGIKVQGVSTLILTKLDVLSYMKEIPICVAYNIDGERVTKFVTDDKLAIAKPIIEYSNGFNVDISKCRKRSDLPLSAMKYIEKIQTHVGTQIKFVSVGPEREDYIIL